MQKHQNVITEVQRKVTATREFTKSLFSCRRKSLMISRGFYVNRVSLLMLLSVILFLFPSGENGMSFAQNGVGIGTLAPDPSALLDIDASPGNNKGVLIPRLTSVQRLAIPAPANSLLVYDTDSSCFFYWNSTNWKSLCIAGTAGTTGTTGDAGLPGVTGANGTTGTIGTTGQVGATGISGATGAIGTTGTTGATGAIGNTGSTGVSGNDGATGTTGANGSTGAIGATGVDSGTNWTLTGNAGTVPGTNFIGTTDPTDWVVKTNSLERVRVLSNGNVGIGTANPEETLRVLGNSILGSATVIPGSFGFPVHGVANDAATSPGDGRILMLSQNNTGIGTRSGIAFQLSSAPGLTNTEATIGAVREVAGTNGVGGLYFATYASGTLVERMRIDRNGNVGIGTTAPAENLHVVGNARVTSLAGTGTRMVTTDANGTLNTQSVPNAFQTTTAVTLSTTSTTWVDMTGTSLTLTTTGGHLLLSFTTQAAIDIPGNIVAFRFTVDGTPVTTSSFGNAMIQGQPGTGPYYQSNIAATWLATGLTAASHTINVQWKVSGGTAMAPEATEESDRTLIVVELK